MHKWNMSKIIPSTSKLESYDIYFCSFRIGLCLDEILSVIICWCSHFHTNSSWIFWYYLGRHCREGWETNFYVVIASLHVVNLEISIARYTSLRWDCVALTMYCLHFNLVILYTLLLATEPICGGLFFGQLVMRTSMSID